MPRGWPAPRCRHSSPGPRARGRLGAAPLRSALRQLRPAYDRAALDALFSIAARADLPGAMRQLLEGEQVNATEVRAALHARCAGPPPAPPSRWRRAPRRCPRSCACASWSKRWPRATSPTSSASASAAPTSARAWIVDALARPDARFRVHFLSNVDGKRGAPRAGRAGPAAHRRNHDLEDIRYAGDAPQRDHQVRDWLGDDARLGAVSNECRARGRVPASCRSAPCRCGTAGGRYSLWSAVGLRSRWRWAWTASRRCWRARRRWMPMRCTRRCATTCRRGTH